MAMGPLGALNSVRCVHIEKKIESLGLKLPPQGKPAANYILCNRSGNLIFTGACSAAVLRGRRSSTRARFVALNLPVRAQLGTSRSAPPGSS
jgi:hypothetical protein